jgi:steroid delta-isomerase-like uncharacterized protein
VKVKELISMSTQENKAIVQHLFDEVFNKGNTSVVNETIAPDYIDHSPIPAPAAGPEGFAKRTSALRAAFVQEVEFGVFLAEGDLVAFTWKFNGVHNGTFAGVPAMGKQVTLSGINVERLENGKIVEH